MKQSLKTTIFLLLALILPATATAYDFEVDGIYYNIIGNEATVTYKGQNYYSVQSYSGNVTIPPTVTYNSTTYPVTSIGADAFFGCSGLTSVTIPNSVTSISNFAFSYCSGLTSVTIPNSVSSISNSAFQYCNGLTSVTIPNSVTSIGNFAFSYCSGLTNVTIPNSLTTIGDHAFSDCSGLTNVTIPNSVTYIGQSAFSDCYQLANVYSYIAEPSNIYTGNGIFSLSSGNYSNRTIHVPSGSKNSYQSDIKWSNYFDAIVEMGFMPTNDNEFYLDNVIYEVTSETSVKVVSADYCAVYVIPNQVVNNDRCYTVTAIGDSAFFGNLKVHDVTLPETVTVIGVAAFKNCPNFKYLTCLSMTPPSTNDSFDEHCQRIPLEGLGIDDYIYEDGEKSDNVNSNYWLVLFVNTDAYSNYKAEFLGATFFSYISTRELTAEPSITEDYIFYYDTGYVESAKVHISETEKSLVYSKIIITGMDYLSQWNQGQEVDYFLGNYYNCKPTYYTIQAFAIAEGKMPSKIQGMYYEFYPLPYLSYDFNESGIYYDILDNNAVEVTFHAYRYPCGEEEKIFNEDSLNCMSPNKLGINDRADYWNYDDMESIFYYTGAIKIPSIATNYYNSSGTYPTYQVVSIGHEAFKNCVDLISIKMPNTISSIGHEAFYGCTGLKRMVLPVSITSIANDAFENCKAESIFITGEGEWHGESLPDSVKTLLIESGVTGVMRMHVNPETIYCYATTPPVCDENSFTGYDAELHVPASSLAAYFTAPYWCNFTNIIGDAVPLTSISLNNDSIEVLKGDQVTIMATLNPTNAMPNTITWQSSNESVAKVEDGVVTALKRGQCDIIVSCQDKRAVCHVTVTEIMPTDVTLNQVNAKMEIGSQLTLTATVLPENATDKTVTWSSSNNNVATVDNNGVVTAMGTGECNIIAYCRGKQAVCHVIVVEHLIYISLDQNEATVLPNHIFTLTPTVSPVSTDLVVTSSNPAVAAARLAGNRIQVVGVSEGQATIVVNSADGYAFADSCLVTVYTERGDVNSDGFVNIADVSAMIDYLLDSDASSVNTVNADANADRDVNIADVSMLIDYLLGNVELPPKDQEPEVEIDEFTVNGVTFNMVTVEGGTFTMGATEEEDADYQVFKGSPQHQVTLSSFSIGQTEVTQELWVAVMGSNPSTDQSDLQYPVNNISWEDCEAFIIALNQLTGIQFRLPTEAEWEYAAKGGARSQGYVYAGSDNLDEVAWINTNSDNSLHQVSTKKANELGLYDMNGNIEEWLNDWYALYTEDPVVNPTGPETGSSRIHRGGRWNSSAKFCRLTRRDGFSPSVTRNYLGLRLALTD